MPPELFHHGTSSKHLPAIRKGGLRSASETGVKNENRQEGPRDRQVYLTDSSVEGKRAAEGYALRATQKTGGEPVVLHIEGDKEAHGIVTERKGRIVQYVAPHMSPETIVREEEVESEVEDMPEKFSGPNQQ